MIQATDGNDRTVLALAALSGKRDTFDTVLSAVERVLHSDKVRHPLSLFDTYTLR